MRRFVPIVVGLLAIAACEPWSSTENYVREDVPTYRADPIKTPATDNPQQVKVMAWNVKFGGGRIDFFFDYWGDRTEMTLPEVEHNLDGVYRLINEVDPDVLIVEEIEVNSRRSAYVDMVTELLERTNLNYGAFYEAWDTRFAPDEATGRVQMGNAIFSKYPISKAERIRQADRTDQAFYETYFLLHRCVGRAEIDIGATTVAVYAVHAEAYDTDGTKTRHVQQLHQLLADETLPVLMGGDFNNIPPSSIKTGSFPDESPLAAGTRYAEPPYDLTAMQAFYDDYVEAIGLERYGTTLVEQEQHYSHSVIGPEHIGLDGKIGGWNRKLDYLFIKPDTAWVEGTTDTLQSVGRMGIRSDPLELSDHCPIVGTWRFEP
jgi:endonuclease/exonuclease/phosphatase family metal-dependent hydrolase